jgi:hypothetical protein
VVKASQSCPDAGEVSLKPGQRPRCRGARLPRAPTSTHAHAARRRQRGRSRESPRERRCPPRKREAVTARASRDPSAAPPALLEATAASAAAAARTSQARGRRSVTTLACWRRPDAAT